MIPVKHDIVQTDNLPGKEYEFGIGDPRWVMQALADTYSNREKAVVREYSTNAYDEHVKFGIDEPIEVTLPNEYENFFVVRDYAEGMSLATLTETYTQFGLSDKRESNDTNGMLGIGSKVGSAYTDSYMVTSIHEGEKIVAVVNKRPDHSVYLKVVAIAPTTERSGVEIKILVHNVDVFNHVARDFYKFWPSGRVRINGELNVQDVGEKVNDTFYLNAGMLNSYVVFGNVAYRLENPSALFVGKPMRYTPFVAYVPNGVFEFSNDRENLKYTETTKARLSALIDDVAKDIPPFAQREIDAATDHFDAYSRWVAWGNRIGYEVLGDLTFKGAKLSSTFEIDAFRWTPRHGNRVRIDKFEVAKVADTLFITGYGGNTGSKHKSMVKEFAQNHMTGHIARYVFTHNEKINSPWVKKDNVYSWEHIKATLPKNVRTSSGYTWNSGRIPGSWDYYSDSGFKTQEPLPVDVKNIFWISVQADKRWFPRRAMEMLGMKDWVVLVVPANRRAKLLRENPNIQQWVNWAKSQVVTDVDSLLSDEAKRYLSIPMRDRNWLNALGGDVEDPAFKKNLDLISRGPELLTAYRKNNELANEVSVYIGEHSIKADETNSLSALYPLLIRLSYAGKKEEVVEYINAVYAARKGKK